MCVIAVPRGRRGLRKQAEALEVEPAYDQGGYCHPQARGSRVLVPGVRHGLHVPRIFGRLLFAALVIGTVVGAWAVFSPGRVSTDGAPFPYSPIADVRSIAYIEPHEGRDHVMVRHSALGSEPQSVYSFDIAISGLHARGAASPDARTIAVLNSGTQAAARMTLLTLTAEGAVASTVAGSYDHLSLVAWAPDSSHLAAVRTAQTAEGTTSAEVIEVDARTGESRVVATVEGARDVAPVGYSIDGVRLFWVVVDNSGSNLWMEREGVVERLAELSPGRTSDWSLSPDGSRLAFVDILGAASRSFVGRTLTIATGSVTTLPATGNQLGSAWRPGGVLPEFGGPGGSLQLSDPANNGSYILPERWAPQGDLVAATVLDPGSDKYAPVSQSLELSSPEHREVITETNGASFLGWVRDLQSFSELEPTLWQ